MAQSRGELLVTKLELGNEKLSDPPTTERLHNTSALGNVPGSQARAWGPDTRFFILLRAITFLKILYLIF